MYNLDERILALRRKGRRVLWTEIIMKLQKRGIFVHPSDLSKMKNGVVRTPKANMVLQACDEILSQIEKEVQKEVS